MAHGSLDGMASRDLALRFLLSALLYSAIGQTASHVDLEPEFLAPLENHTVTQGRDVSFTCVVNHLQSYRVAWIKSDSRAILAMHTHMVAPNPRLSVTHNGHNTWKLHVDDVRPEDSGTYMCQVNTDPMRSLVGHMKVVTPPDIIDLEEGADRLTSLEHGDVELQCRATGNPKPEITWRREDGRDIVLRTDATTDIVVMKAYKNESLRLSKILRQEMGSYLCIASNGVPPSVSKRYYVNVYFKPTIKIREPIVNTQIDMDVTLECYVESNPKSLTTWYTRNGAKLAQDERHEVSERSINDFTFLVSLTMRRIQQSDFSSYTCFTENSLGKTNVVFRLREERQPKVTSTSKQFKHRNNTSALNKDEKNKKAPNDRLNSIANAENSDKDMTSRNNGDILKHTDSNYQETYGSTDSRYLSGSASAIEILSDIVTYLTLTALIVILY